MGMDETALRLDGNAMAGLLAELFVDDVTGARGACATCGSVAGVGEQHAYMYPHSPGAVLRCAGCESVLMVVVRTPGHVRFGLQGLTWLEVAQPGATT
ncbi:MAG: DUF6510 family protein [Candidatus Dormiibacterota bacterium]